MTSLPTGTVTFLFTDIEGSTRLLEHLGDRSIEAVRIQQGHQVHKPGAIGKVRV